MRLRSALLAAASFGLPAAAMAQPITGLYIAGGGGGSLQQDEVVRASPALGTPGFKARFNAGGTGVASVGYGFGNGMRIELEGDYRYNSIEKIEGGTPATAGGNQEQYGAMVNGLYDFDFGSPYAFPYVGVGAGYQWTKWNHVHNVAADGSYFLGSDNSFGNFAYQGIVGVAFPVAPMPGLSATVEYRFLGEEGESSMKGANYTPLPGGGFHQARGNWDFDNEFNHSIMVGLRYAFGIVPPPPPPPAPAPASVPAPAPARTYLVFFDWDKADLTDRARQIIHAAADASTHVQTTRIDVDGYTDLSGTPKYNMGLSIRRADAVKAELIRDGVPDNEIEAQGFGETHPLVPTAQGVREPQNRRVEIILR
jgi:outer membrane protein OmpA-like peptidoglycan-associated protein/outer membrane protein W